MNLALRRILPSRSVGTKSPPRWDQLHLISPEGIHVDVPEKDVEAALARGFKWDMETLLKEARSYGKGDKRSPEQAILAELSDEELDALQSDILLCMSKQRDVLSRQDLVDSGIAMAEIAYARQYRSMGNLIAKNDEERVKEYNALVAKYNELLARCPH